MQKQTVQEMLADISTRLEALVGEVKAIRESLPEEDSDEH